MYNLGNVPCSNNMHYYTIHILLTSRYFKENYITTEEYCGITIVDYYSASLWFVLLTYHDCTMIMQFLDIHCL